MAVANDYKWYVLRVTYSRELKVKAYLESEGIQTFIPMQYTLVERGGKREKVLQPLVHNLIFVYSTREIIDYYKHLNMLASQLRYIMDREKRVPIVVPEKQMQDFIAVAGSNDEQILYLSPDELHLKKGDRVRINSGVWRGVEGRFVSFKGGMRVVVAIEGIMAVATVNLSPSMVDKLPNQED